MALLDSMGFALVVGLLFVGLCVGSFLNVVIHRLPIMLTRTWRREAAAELGVPEAGDDLSGERFNLAVPRSHCPACGEPVKAFDNIPIVGWIRLRGRCPDCAAPISLRYPLVEALGALALVAAVLVFGMTWTAVAAAACLWVLIALAFIDLESGLLPDQLTLPLLWSGLLVNLPGAFTHLASAVVGAVVGYLFLWLTYWAFKLATGKEGMGYGDFKLFAALGAWLGWQALPAVALLSAVAGILYALPPILLGRRDRNAPIRFGPFLAGAGSLVLIFRAESAWLLGI